MSKETFGERLVGASFNVSSSSEIDEVKSKCAELANLLKKKREHRLSGGVDYTDSLVYDSVMKNIVETSMMAVKYITLQPNEIPEG